MTGSTRSSTRRQFKTSFVVFRSTELVPDFMKDEASAVTDDVEMEGNVWSERRLNRREVTTWISVITFSGASTRARRTARF